MNDVTKSLADEVLHLKAIHRANLGEDALNPKQLLNKITIYKLDELFGSVCIALRSFCTLSVTVAYLLNDRLANSNGSRTICGILWDKGELTVWPS